MHIYYNGFWRYLKPRCHQDVIKIYQDVVKVVSGWGENAVEMLPRCDGPSTWYTSTTNTDGSKKPIHHRITESRIPSI